MKLRGFGSVGRILAKGSWLGAMVAAVMAVMVVRGALGDVVCQRPMELWPAMSDPGGFGSSISAVPDTNGDGVDDLMIGADVAGVGGGGRAQIVDGATGQALHVLMSPNDELLGYFGDSVSGVPDINGDNLGDVVVGAPDEDPGDSPAGAGRVYLFDGATASLLYTLISPHEQKYGGFGCAVSGLPDLDGDGRGELVIGAYTDDAPPSPSGAGRVYIFSGATGSLLRTLTSPHEEASGFFGRAVSSVPDTNGDGYPDLVVGAMHEDRGSPFHEWSGRAYIMDPITGQALHELAGSYHYQGLFGSAVSGIPDVNGDSCGDVVVGAPCEFDYHGRAYVFDGASGTLLHTLFSGGGGSLGDFGKSVAGVADLSGDGLGDVVIGAPGEYRSPSPMFAGRAHIFDGATGSLLQTLTAPKEEECGDFGCALGASGDLDADGLGDIVVGWEDLPWQAYIFLSGPQGDLNRDGDWALWDILRLVDMVLDIPPAPSPYELWAADLDGDGDQDLFDVLALIDLVLS